MSEEYDEKYYDSYGKEGKGYTYNVYYEINAFLYKQFLALPDDAKVLDVGCAMGFFVKGLRKAGLDAYGCDVSEYAINNNVTETSKFLRVGDVLKLPFKDSTFDVVFCMDLVEHLDKKDIPQAIKELRRVSKEWVVIQTLFKDEEHHKEMYEADSTHKTWENKDWWLRTLEVDKYGYVIKPYEMIVLKRIFKFPHPDQLIITKAEAGK